MENWTRQQEANLRNRSDVKWKSVVEYYDIDTGESITKYNANKNYNKIKTDRHARIEGINGTITYTTGWRRKQQLTIW